VGDRRRLEPLVVRDADGRYAADGVSRRVLAGVSRRPPADRRLGGVHLAPGDRRWAWHPERREIWS
jgi:hypothetical protein